MHEFDFAGWIDGVTAEQRKCALAAVDALLAAGADRSSAEWHAREHVDGSGEGFQMWMFLHAVWTRTIDTWLDTSGVEQMARVGARGLRAQAFSDADVAVARMVAAGVAVSDLCDFARYVAYATAFGVCNLLDEGFHPDVHTSAEWMVVAAENGRPTSRAMIGLHEWILGADPSGREGSPA